MLRLGFLRDVIDLRGWAVGLLCIGKCGDDWSRVTPAKGVTSVGTFAFGGPGCRLDENVGRPVIIRKESPGSGGAIPVCHVGRKLSRLVAVELIVVQSNVCTTAFNRVAIEKGQIVDCLSRTIC